jgi:hypothetical protein
MRIFATDLSIGLAWPVTAYRLPKHHAAATRKTVMSEMAINVPAQIFCV